MAKGLQGSMVSIAWHFTCVGNVAGSSINKGQWGNQRYSTGLGIECTVW